MRSRFSNQTIAGVVAASTLLLLFFVLQLGLLSIVLALFVFLGSSSCSPLHLPR